MGKNVTNKTLCSIWRPSVKKYREYQEFLGTQIKMIEEKTKVCTKCGRELPLSEFTKHKITKDGLDHCCKSCQNEYYKIWYKTHRSDALTNMQKYYKCISKPSCQRVGGRGAQFELFVCEVCGTEFRRRKSEVDWIYEHRGYLPQVLFE